MTSWQGGVSRGFHTAAACASPVRLLEWGKRQNFKTARSDCRGHFYFNGFELLLSVRKKQKVLSYILHLEQQFH